MNLFPCLRRKPLRPIVSIIEFDRCPRDCRGKQVNAVPANGRHQLVRFSGKAAVSEPFRNSFVRVAVDKKMHFKVGDSPTATIRDPLLVPGGSDVFAVKAGQRIAFVVA